MGRKQKMEFVLRGKNGMLVLSSRSGSKVEYCFGRHSKRFEIDGDFGCCCSVRCGFDGEQIEGPIGTSWHVAAEEEAGCSFDESSCY